MILENAEDIRASRQSLKAIANPLMENKDLPKSSETGQDSAMSYGSRGYIKRFIPYFIYRPPFGYPRRDIDILNVRKLAQTPFVFSVIKTLLDEVCSLKWDIVAEDDIDEESIKGKIKSIKDFFYNPNDNDDSFRDLLREVLKDILELDAGVIEKVYNRAGQLTQLYSVDGSTILKNPDEHGYMGDRAEYIPPVDTSGLSQQHINNYYMFTLNKEAAYFQYNWTGGIWPVPFGKKELVYIKSNTRSDSIYGTSPIMVLYNIILTLMYATQVNLDMYVNNDLPNGVLSILNANKQQIDATRDYFTQKIINKDEFGNNRKKFFSVPITSTEAKYINFNLNAKDMQMLEQQNWYQKLVYSVFGVTSEEMGDSDNSNRSTSNESSRIFKRKALKPIINLIEYNLTTKIIWDLDPTKQTKFKFDDYDVEAEFRKSELNEKLLNTWTINEIREKDNMKAIEGEEYDKVKNAGSSGFNNPFQANSFGSNPKDFTDQDKTNNQANKDDVKNEERSPEKEDKVNEKNPSTKSLDDSVPNITSSEKMLKKMYDSLEKNILNSLD